VHSLLLSDTISILTVSSCHDVIAAHCAFRVYVVDDSCSYFS
jgi:hypothetical protein